MSDTYPTRTLDDGRILCVVPLTFGRARLCVSPAGDPLFFTDQW